MWRVGYSVLVPVSAAKAGKNHECDFVGGEATAAITAQDMEPFKQISAL